METGPYVDYQKACKTLSKIQASGQGKYKDAAQGITWSFRNSKAITAGIYQPGAPLPSAAELERLYGRPVSVKPSSAAYSPMQYGASRTEQ
jgi:hypothetical protein